MGEGVTVVISAFTMRRWPDIEAGFEALAEQSLRPDAVVLMVDSCPELSERARATGRRCLPQLVVHDFVGGLSAARNLGTDQSSSPIVAYLDDDARPDKHWLVELTRPFGDPAVALTGGDVLPAWPDGQRPRWFPDEFLWVVGATYAGMLDGRAIRNPIGASMAVRRSAWALVGGFREDIGLGAGIAVGCEETDFAVRVMRAAPDARVVFCPGSIVDHRVTPERAQPGYFVSRCWLEGKSKGAFGRLYGPGSLAPERTQLVRTIPRAAYRELRSIRRRPGALARAGFLCLGVGVTGCGFAYGYGASKRREAP